MLHTGLIAAHALSGAAAFILGVLLVARRGDHPAQATLYVIALTLMALFVTGAVSLGWHALPAGIRGLFAALLGLAAYTVWRGWQARRKLIAAGPSLPGGLDDLAFTLITLFTGFVVILADDLGGPVWLVVVLGILAVITGRRLSGLVKARHLRLAGQPCTTRQPSTVQLRVPARSRPGADQVEAGSGRRLPGRGARGQERRCRR